MSVPDPAAGAGLAAVPDQQLGALLALLVDHGVPVVPQSSQQRPSCMATGCDWVYAVPGPRLSIQHAEHLMGVLAERLEVVRLAGMREVAHRVDAVLDRYDPTDEGSVVRAPEPEDGWRVYRDLSEVTHAVHSEVFLKGLTHD